MKTLRQAISERKPWILERTKGNQIVLMGKREGIGGEEKESSTKNEETEKEPKVDKDQSLESNQDGERDKGEIIESRAKSSSVSMSNDSPRRWKSNLWIEKLLYYFRFFEGKIETSREKRANS